MSDGRAMIGYGLTPFLAPFLPLILFLKVAPYLLIGGILYKLGAFAFVRRMFSF